MTHPLHEAALRGDAALIRRLLEENGVAAIDALHPSSGWTPLMYAAMSKSYAAVEVLLDFGADVNKRHATGNTAFGYAVFAGSAAIAELMLERDADMHLQNNLGQTAVIWAQSNNKTEMLALLEAVDADRKKRGYSPQVAISRKKLEKLRPAKPALRSKP